ncbi:hypothetical protein G6F36_009237 [Rhizopus arrhizus]|nr:hypothetical protein G6F36_009237 [Rhizopus arrhizus]
MKRKRQLSSDAQWCLENKHTLSLKKFVEKYSLTDRHYASSRYRTIITKYLINDQRRLLLEYNAWKNSEDSTRFWTSIRRKKIHLDTHARALDYVGDVVNEEIDQLCKDKDHTSPVSGTAVNEKSWMFFLNQLYHSLFNHMMNNKKETSTANDKVEEIVIKMSRVIQAVEDNEMTRSDAELELLNFARGQTYYLSRVIRGINNTLQKLPSNVIKDTNSFSENELFNTYFDPILSSIISDPEKNTLLRWSNKKPEENKDMRPDATVTKIHQLKYGYNLGHGEVKTKTSTCDNHALAHDLLRISNTYLVRDCKNELFPVFN